MVDWIHIFNFNIILQYLIIKYRSSLISGIIHWLLQRIMAFKSMEIAECVMAAVFTLQRHIVELKFYDDIRVSTSSRNHGKHGKSLKKKFHAWKNHGI